MLQVGYTITESGQYVTPPPHDLRSYLSHIEKFPLIPMPEAFGLHANADITKDLNETSLILKSMLQQQEVDRVTRKHRKQSLNSFETLSRLYHLTLI